VKAHIRHNYTNYDELVFELEDRHLAREKVSDKIEKILDRWR